MEGFIATYPELIMWFGGVLLTFIGVLIAAIVFFVKRYLDDTSATIRSFNDALDIIKKDLGIIKDRMQRQETICEMQRKFCPYWRQTSLQLAAPEVPPIPTEG